MRTWEDWIYERREMKSPDEKKAIEKLIKKIREDKEKGKDEIQQRQKEAKD